MFLSISDSDRKVPACWYRRRGTAGGGARVTAGPKRSSLSWFASHLGSLHSPLIPGPSTLLCSMVQSPDLFPSYQISDFIQRQGPQEHKHARRRAGAPPLWQLAPSFPVTGPQPLSSLRRAGNWVSSVQSLSRVRLFVTLWTVAHQAPLSMGLQSPTRLRSPPGSSD